MPCTDQQSLPTFPATPDLLEGYGISPTGYSLYPCYLQTFVKERGDLSLEEAIKKATSVPAQEVFGLEDRGILREGAYADIVLFDLKKIGAAVDFLEPTRPPDGIELAVVNGTVVYENMKHTGAKPGKVLRHN
jgi:N-acyl-D-amino-acid deacylase